MARQPVIAKIPWMPIALSRDGAAMKETANTTPMVEPMIAMALVRCESRVRSATAAMATPEMAPAPWRMRPAIMAQGPCAMAQTKLPAAKSARPA